MIKKSKLIYYNRNSQSA